MSCVHFFISFPDYFSVCPVNRQVILEKVPKQTADELYQKFPEAYSVIMYPYGVDTKGYCIGETNK